MNRITSNPLSLFSFHEKFDLEKICLPLLLILSCAAIFFQLGARSLENQCYIRYAEVAREMIRSGDWIVPRLEGDLFLHKPALIIWLIALPSALVGKVTPLLARLPSALSAVAIIGLTYFLGKRMFRDFRVGAIAALILLSSKEFFWQARTARADMVIALLILFSLLCFYLAYDSSGKKRFLLLTLFFVGMALGTLTKGPIVIVFYLGIVAAFLFFKNKLKMFFEPGFLWGLVFFTLIILSWVLPYLIRIPFSTVAEKFSLSEILSRPEPFYYYLVEFWPRFAPWSLFLPAAVVFFFRQNPDQRDEKRFLLSWIVIIIAFISPIQNKTYRYLLPIFPAYSIILGAAFKEGFLSAAPIQDWIGRFWKYPVRFYLFIFLITFLPAPFLAWWFTRSAAVTLVSMGIFLGGSILIGYAIFRGKALAKVVVIGLCSLLIYETYYYFISFEDKKHSPFMQVAESIKVRTDSEALCFFDFSGEKAILIDFYLDTVVPKLSGASDVVNFLTKNNEPKACLTSQQGFTQISQDLSPKSLEVYPITYYKKATYYLIISKRE